MKKYSMLRVIIFHPLKTFILSIIMTFVLLCISIILNINFGDDEMYVFLIGGVVSAAYILKRRYNKGYAGGSTPKRKKSWLFGMVRHMNNSVDRYGNSVENALMNAFTGSSSRAADEARYRAQQQQADAAARARWNALDRQKKAEWDARDAALRGKDKAAYQYQNQADYWRKQSKR
ncbi:MAG: hypothetical protein HFG96_01745 [Lachnospiraceae bacterium]|jgi:hypothetical protein|nr:hypothetical protein [Lachnospiraceae bacterium]